MPSLKQLEEFKTSFRNIGNEIAVLTRQNLPLNDLVLPDSEPVIPPEPAPPAEDEYEDPGIRETEPGSSAEPEAAETAPSPDFADFDFSAFLDTIPDDLPMPVADIPEVPPPAGDDDFNTPDTLLEGLAEDGETGASSPDIDDGEDFPAEPDFGEDLSTGTFPMDDDALFGDFSGPDFEPTDEAGESAEDIPPVSDDFSADFDLPLSDEDPLSLPEDSAPLSEDELLADLPPLDLLEEGNEQAPVEAEPLDDKDSALSFPEPDTGDAEIPLFENADGDEPVSSSAETDPLNLTGEIAGSGDYPAADTTNAEAAGDTFESFNLDNEAPEPGGPSSPEGGSGEFSDLEEFSLVGIDDVFSKSPLGAAAPAASEQGAEVVDTVEKIQLNEEELAQLQKTLALYPLNLRIACEEVISEQTASPNFISSLVKLLIKGASAKETASLAGKILDRTISIPKGFEKKTGEALEIEQASFPYIFVHKFLPIMGLVLFIAMTTLSLFYLIYRFIYTPARANSIYQAGYERIEAGEFARANDRFTEAFRMHRVKDWFYRYAEAFRDLRQYIYAEEKYDELLRYYPRDKKGALDYADLETNYLRNYPKADTIIRRNILDYAVDDREALLALGDINLAWGEIDNTRYDEARRTYARLLERYGWQDPIVERMMKYFIRTDNLAEVIPLQDYFLNSSRKRKITPATLAELGGYLLDKRFEEVRGVPDENISRIDGIRDMLLQAVTQDPSLPEAHYHLARYYGHYGYNTDERQTLAMAVRTFAAVPEESAKRVGYRIDALRRYAQVLINAREFFPAEEQLVTGINLYEDGISRRLLSPSPEFGRLYADLGDLEYFTKDGDMESALQYYSRSERNGWAPPEIQYRMGSACYHLRQWSPALERFFAVSIEMPVNRRLLHALGNAAYMRGDYHAAQGYYQRLLDVLDAERARFPLLSPNDRPEHMELAERLMVTRNNLGVTMETLAEQTGNNSYRSRALGHYAESARAWDTITRNPATMVRAGAADLSTPGVNLAYLNSRNTLNPVPGYEPQIYLHIDKDVVESSIWESLVPSGYRLSDEITFYR
jgi:tetratricopeptide (TPR) repeat protein